MGIVAFSIEQAPESIFHGPCSRCINMAFCRGQMDDIFPEKIFRNGNALRKNFIQSAHFGLRFVSNPLYLLGNKIIFFRDFIFFINNIQLI